MDCLQLSTLRHALTKNDVISEKLHFHFLGEQASKWSRNLTG